MIPALPQIDPFTLTVDRDADLTFARGFVPSEELTAALQQLFPLLDTEDVTIADGPISETWGDDVLTLLDMADPLEKFSLALSNNDATLDGLTEDRNLRDQLVSTFADLTTVPGLNLHAQISLGPFLLETSRVHTALQAHADCGELTLLGTPPNGFGPDDNVVVVGRVASNETRVALRDAITAMAGDRRVAIETEVQNPTLCTIDAALPDAPAAGFDIKFAQGDTGKSNPTGRFFQDENPVIDVTIPADVTEGFLLVTALDVSGKVFHMLPNNNRPDNSIEALRDGATGPVDVRVAYSIAESEASGGRKLAFRVDDTSLGKTKILVMHTEDDILGGIPQAREESAQIFADTLRAWTGPVLSLDSRILTTVKP